VPHTPRVSAQGTNDAGQILKNDGDVKKAPELCVERNMAGYNYFTKGPVESFVGLAQKIRRSTLLRQA
jgi:hypothetical protein